MLQQQETIIMEEHKMEGGPCIVPYMEMSMNQRRHLEVSKVITEHQIGSVIELGCSEGELLVRLTRHSELSLIVGVDIEESVIERAGNNVNPECIQKDIQWARQTDQDVWLFQGDALVKYPQLLGFQVDLVAMVDVIEHLQPEMIEPAMDNVMGYLRPAYFFVSTPNYEYNSHFGNKKTKYRHADHKFEWTRKEFQQFCELYAGKYAYSYEIRGIGEHPKDDSKGYCTQYALFRSASAFEAPEHVLADHDLREVKHFQNLCWKNNIDDIMLGLLFEFTLPRDGSTFERALQIIKLRKLGEVMPNISKEFLVEHLERHSDKFDWDQDSFKRKEDSDSDSDMVQEEVGFVKQEGELKFTLFVKEDDPFNSEWFDNFQKLPFDESSVESLSVSESLVINQVSNQKGSGEREEFWGFGYEGEGW